MQDQDLRVTIRLLPEKRQVYRDFKQLCTETLHTDICYVTTMLMESFTAAMNNKPNPDAQAIMKFLKQSVQINMGCNFNYYTKKARRTPQDLTTITTDPHNLLPELTTDFPQLTNKSRQWWIQELQNQGFTITPPQTTKPNSPIEQSNLPIEQSNLPTQDRDKSHTKLHVVTDKIRLWFHKLFQWKRRSE